MGKKWKWTSFLFFVSIITVGSDFSYKIKRHLLAPWKKSYDRTRKRIKKHRRHFDDKGLYSQSYGISSDLVRVGPQRKLSAVEFYFQIALPQKTLNSPLVSREIKLVTKSNLNTF